MIVYQTWYLGLWVMSGQEVQGEFWTAWPWIWRPDCCSKLWYCLNVDVGWDSSVGIVTCHGLDRPGIKCWWGVIFSAPIQSGPRAHPSSCTMGTRSFPGVKWLGRGVYHPPSSSAKIKERGELYLCSLSGPSWPACFRVNLTLHLPLTVDMV